MDILRQQLNKLLISLSYSKGGLKESTPSDLAEALIWAIVKGGDAVPVVVPVLKNAAMHCLHRKGDLFQETQNHHNDIREAIEQLLGWLVLSSIDEVQLAKFLPVIDVSKGMFFELPVETAGGVEVIVSHSYRRAANILSSGSEVEAKHLIRISVDQFNWNEVATADVLKLEIWNTVFPDLKQDITLTVQQVKTLNSELLTRRNDEWDTEHYFLAMQCNSFGLDFYEKVYTELRDGLENLTLVNFGVPGKEAIFYMPEHNLMQAVNRFLASINQEK